MYRSPRGSFGKEADAVSAVTAYAAQAAHFILPVIALIVLIRCVASMFYGRAEPETWGHLVIVCPPSLAIAWHRRGTVF